MITTPPDAELDFAALITVRDSLRVRPGERVLIITNPDPEVTAISQALYRQVLVFGGRPNLIWQEEKSQLDDMDPAVLAALKTEPDIYISMSKNKIGKDPEGRARPYQLNGETFDSITAYLIHGKKCTRGFWSPGVTRALYVQTVPVDFPRMKTECAFIKTCLDQVETVRIKAPGGTDLRFSVKGRWARVDDGDYSQAGSGGNLPAGESYISPVNGSAEGTIVYDGSMSTNRGTLLCRTPITVVFEQGYITNITGGEEADGLRQSLELAAKNALELENQGKLPPGQGAIYARNARHLGELGIGVNPLAPIVGSMIVDEKAARTCHLAIGSNYDNDAPALIHLDGVVRQPTIILELPGGSQTVLLRDGELCGIESPRP